MKAFKRIGAVLLIAALILVTFAACGSPAKKMVGKWEDANGFSGYEFKEDGTVTITYMNFTVPVINTPISGTFNGTYSVEKVDKDYYVSINATFNVFVSIPVDFKYKVEVEDASLKLTTVNEDGSLGETYTYTKKGE